ncbi:MAG: hypothetical protein Q8Q10_00030 [bacterium]|nr:hypothetical protein [bacterium]
MSKLSHSFKKIEAVVPASDLEHKILHAISLEKSARIKHRLMASYAGLLGSFATLLYVGVTSAVAFLESDFLSLLSLAFSDAAAVAQYWNTFLLALLETVPVLPLILILIPILTLFLFFSMYFSTVDKRHYSY